MQGFPKSDNKSDSLTRGGVLFVVPSGEVNGATTSLLHFIRWFKRQGGRPFAVLLASQGELAARCGELGETWVADQSHWCPGGLRSRALKATGLGRWARAAESRDLRRFAGKCSPALVYVNSVTREGARLAALVGLGVPVLTHVHELESLLLLQAGEALPHVLAGSSRFIACSNAVRDNLTKHGVTADRIGTVHEAIPVAETRAAWTRNEMFHDLGIPEGALLVAGCGTLGWRKGSDLFIQLARAVNRECGRAYFTWIGGFPWQVELLEFRHDARAVGLNGSVRVTGMVSNPADYLAAADVFVLTSRDDPYPLACLEAAALGKPIVCFADAGGMPEFVEDDCGFVVPYLDVPAMAERVLCLLDSRECRMKMGAAARRKVTERHDISVAGPQIMDIIERTIAGA